MDIIRVSVEFDSVRVELIFKIEFADDFTEEFQGGIEFYYPERELAPFDSNWFFNNTGNVSLNFHLIPPVDLFPSGIFGVEGGEWLEQTPENVDFFIRTSVIQTSGVQGDILQIARAAVRLLHREP